MAPKVKNLAYHLASVPDPRSIRGKRHLLLDILVIVVQRDNAASPSPRFLTDASLVLSSRDRPTSGLCLQRSRFDTSVGIRRRADSWINKRPRK